MEKAVKIKGFRFYYFGSVKDFNLGISIAKRNFHLGLGFFSVGAEW